VSNNDERDEVIPVEVKIPTFFTEEVFRHMAIGHAVVNVEAGLAVLAKHAGDLLPELAQRVLDAIAAYGDARRALVDPLTKPHPAPGSRN
jgi:hypothetical protein